MLDEIIKDPNKSLDRVEEILKLESASDEVNEKIISKLNLSFITPIDREDIYAIAGELATGVDCKKISDMILGVVMKYA